MDDAPDAATDGSAVTSSSGVKPEVAGQSYAETLASGRLSEALQAERDCSR